MELATVIKERYCVQGSFDHFWKHKHGLQHGNRFTRIEYFNRQITTNFCFDILLQN